MSRIAVIDFETANHQPHSACQLGVVILEGWQIEHEQEWLIRPQRMFFSPRCIAVHGIRPGDVMSSPTWDQVWGELQPILDGCVVIAHNVGFDAGVLSATCRAHDIAVSPLDIQCTRLIAKRTWPGRTSYGLAALAEFLNIEFKHHNALEDSRASARVLTLAAERLGVGSLDEMEDRLGLVRGKLWTESVRHPRSVRRSRIEMVAEPQPRYEQKRFRNDGTPASIGELRQSRMRADQILAACGTEKPLAGKSVVLLNSLLGLDREDAVGFLTQLGAVVQSNINLQTHFLIIGAPGRDAGKPGTEETDGNSPEMGGFDEVARRQKDGQPIRILSQRQLLACIPSGLAIARGDF